MQAVTGVFLSQTEAEQAVRKLQSSGIQADRVTLLTPGGKGPKKLESVPVDATEQPGMGTAIGAVVGGATGLSGGVVAAVVPGIGPVTAIGLLGAAVLTTAGASLGAVAGGLLESFMTEGLPEDEIFVYEDALRKGRTVVIALAEDAAAATPIRKLLKASPPAEGWVGWLLPALFFISWTGFNEQYFCAALPVPSVSLCTPGLLTIGCSLVRLSIAPIVAHRATEHRPPALRRRGSQKSREGLASSLWGLYSSPPHPLAFDD